MNCEIENFKFTMVAIYAPNTQTERVRFFKDVKILMQDNEQYTIIMGGDFNTIIDHTLDKKGGRPAELQSGKSLKDNIFKVFDVHDIWRYRNPKKLFFTHKQTNPVILTRIDFWLISKSLTKDIYSCDILPSIKSDHRAISMIFTVRTSIRGKGFWRLNVHILKNINYQNGIDDIIKDFTRKYNDSNIDKRIIWDLLKIKLKEFSVQFSIQEAKKTRLEETHFQNKLQAIERMLDNNSDDADLITQHREVLCSLENHYEYKARGAQIRSRAQWIEKGERSTKYFLNLEKHHAANNSIDSLNINPNHTTSHGHTTAQTAWRRIIGRLVIQCIWSAQYTGPAIARHRGAVV